PSAYRHAVCKKADLRSRHPRQLWLRLYGCLSDARNEKVTLQNNLLLRPGAFTTPLFHFSSLHIRKIFSMNTLPDTHVREASHCQSPVTIWQTLLTRLLDQHYGLTLNDTPFADERVIEQHIEAGISLCDAVNFLVEKYALVRTDQPGFSACTRSQLINSIDILRARRATGLMARDNYRTVNNITLGKHPGAKQ
ncbi:hypothetical protein HMPREF9542_04404, partial [Escherichia coli MS 117-3]